MEGGGASSPLLQLSVAAGFKAGASRPKDGGLNLPTTEQPTNNNKPSDQPTQPPTDQVEGVKFMLECLLGLRKAEHTGAVLADGMGLGKASALYGG